MTPRQNFVPAVRNSAAHEQPFVTLGHLGRALGGRLPPLGAKIGLLGGSFNPAHHAHLELSLNALKFLDLDEVWWLVSPQNPLKSKADMAPLADRLASARSLAKSPHIRVSALESALGTRFSADTLKMLKNRLPGRYFVWLLGADNLAELEKWRNWQQIFHQSPVAVFDRPTYALKALASKAARTFGSSRLEEHRSRELAKLRPPVWVFLHTRQNPLSATKLRSKDGHSRDRFGKR